MLASSESESVSTENPSIEPYPSREHIRRMCYFWSEITTGAAVEKEVGEEVGGVEDGGGGFGVEVVAGPKASHHSEVTWVKDGVAICKETRLEDFPPGLHAVASCWGLELDASQFSPVRNAAYESRLGEILDLYARGAHRPVIG